MNREKILFSGRKNRPPRRHSLRRRIFNHLAYGLVGGFIGMNLLAEANVWRNDHFVVTGGQPLSAGEVQLIEDIFGESASTSIIRKHFDKVCRRDDGKEAEACVANGSDRHLFFRDPKTHADDYARAQRMHRVYFMHEVTHLWQYQNHPTLYINWFKGCDSYDYDLSGNVDFDDFCVEQQANIIADYTNYVLYPASWPPGIYKGPEEGLQVLSQALIRVVEDKFPQARETRLRKEAEYQNKYKENNGLYVSMLSF